MRTVGELSGVGADHAIGDLRVGRMEGRYQTGQDVLPALKHPERDRSALTVAVTRHSFNRLGVVGGHPTCVRQELLTGLGQVSNPAWRG